MSYAELRNRVIEKQKEIARVNHKMETPRASHGELAALRRTHNSLFEEWKIAVAEMRAHPHYVGRF